MARLTVSLILGFTILGVGCKHEPPQIITKVVTQEVKVPVPTKVEPPADLLVPLTPLLPAFVSPGDPSAVSALTAEGEQRLKILLLLLQQRIAAWQAWATEPAK